MIAELLIVPYGIETFLYCWLIECFTLLIVPYGIETLLTEIHDCIGVAFNRTLWNWNDFSSYTKVNADTLLIVPYGIETPFFGLILCFNHLLIVPYGIETCVTNRTLKGLPLLIVPYGIETPELPVAFIPYHAFNRTLWNWNNVIRLQCNFGFTFNRTLWNWNVLVRSGCGSRYDF